jgi:hypothetical protein
MTARALEGNGVQLVRERALASAVQNALERLYQLERVADVHAFMQPAEANEREALLFREHHDGSLEIALRVPSLGRREIDVANDADLDPMCQIIEGVSHFVYLADRARLEREATQLELELQAEVDKYVVLAASMESLDARASAMLRRRLYEDVSFAHEASSELGERYRIANDLAHTFVRKLEREYVTPRKLGEMRIALRRFYRMGQADKLRVGRAA